MSIRKIKRKNRKDGWKATVYNRSGNQLSRTFDRKADAELWESEQRLEKTKRPSESIEPIRFKELVEIFSSVRKTRVAESTWIRYEQLIRVHLLPVFGNQWANEIQTKEVELWFSKITKEGRLQKKTLNHILSLLKQILSWGVSRKYLYHDPSAPIERHRIEKKVIDFWDSKEASNFLNFHQDNHYYNFYLFAINTGMRKGELIGLLWDCIDLDKKLIRVCRTWCDKSKRIKETTKGRKNRFIPLNPLLVQTLRLMARNKSSTLVFTDPRGRMIDAGHFTQRVFYKDIRKAEIRKIKFHEIRHTYASIYLQNDGSMFSLSRLMGHTTQQVTEMYSHLKPGHLKDYAEIVMIGAEKVTVLLDYKAKKNNA